MIHKNEQSVMHLSHVQQNFAYKHINSNFAKSMFLTHNCDNYKTAIRLIFKRKRKTIFKIILIQI